MSANSSLWWARGAKARRLAHPTAATPIGVKMIIAGVVTVLALLYAKGVTLMIDAADKPSPYTTFLYRAD